MNLGSLACITALVALCAYWAWAMRRDGYRPLLSLVCAFSPLGLVAWGAAALFEAFRMHWWPALTSLSTALLWVLLLVVSAGYAGELRDRDRDRSRR